MRVGVVGTGFGKSQVAPAFARVPGVQVVEVVSPRDEADVAALCRRPDVDLVSVHSPPFLHTRDVAHALSAGRAVACDKPFGRTAKETAAIHRAAEAAGVPHFAALEMRFEPWRQQVRDAIRSGALGEVESVDWHESSPYLRTVTEGWLVDADRGGGWLAASASHALDTLRWWLGEMSVEQATFPPAPTAAAHGGTAERGCEAVLRSADGVRCSLRTSAVAAHRIGARVVVSGSEGTIERAADGKLHLYGAAAGRGVPDGVPPAGDALGTWCGLIAATLDGAERSTDLPDLVDGLACATTMDEIRLLARS